jgi:hypothetical protein
MLTVALNSRRKSQPMVRSWRPGIYHRLIMHGPADDSGTGLPILGTCTAEVCTVHDLGLYGFFLDYRLPVVFLGLLAGFQLLCHEWVYWKFGPFWFDGYIGDAVPWITAHS